MSKSGKIEKYSTIGLFLFVAIPLPGTGAWSGSMIAALLGMKLNRRRHHDRRLLWPTGRYSLVLIAYKIQSEKEGSFMSWVLSLDNAILDAIQRLRCPLLDWFMPLYSRLGDHGMVCIALAALLLLFPKTRRAGEANRGPSPAL